MNTIAAPFGATERSRPATDPRFSPRSWRQAMPALSTAALIIAVIALTFSIFGPNGLGGDDNGDPGHFAAAPLATAAPDDISTTRPYPGANECTVEPMTREEMIDHFQQANTATFQRRPHYEQPIKPTTEERDAILHTFNSWLACGLDTPTSGPAYQLRIQTPWYTAGSLPIFGFGYTPDVDLRPVSDEAIVEYVDAILDGEARETATPGVAASPVATRDFATPEWVPMPPNATPVVLAGGGAGPVLFADDIMITGPETASAQVVFVNEVTNAVEPGFAYTARFVLTDGHWLLDSYTEAAKG